MTATWNPDVTVNILGATQGVQRRNFGIPLLATAAVEAGFTPELYRVYESNGAAQADADLSAATKAAAAAHYGQDGAPQKLMVGKVAYATLGADLSAILAAVGPTTDFYGVTCASRVKADQIALAAWVLANSRFAVVQSDDSEILAKTALNTFDTIRDLNNNRTAMLYHDDTEHADVAWLSRILSRDLDTGSSVAYDKTLSGITASAITDADKAAVLDEAGNLFMPLFGADVTGPGKLAGGKWIDELLSEDWIKARIGEAIAQLKIKQSNLNQKIPYNNTGLRMLKGAIAGAVGIGETVGHFEAAHTVYSVPDISAVSAPDILARQCTIAVTLRLTGAIKDITVNVGVVNA